MLVGKHVRSLISLRHLNALWRDGLTVVAEQRAENGYDGRNGLQQGSILSALMDLRWEVLWVPYCRAMESLVLLVNIMMLILGVARCCGACIEIKWPRRKFRIRWGRRIDVRDFRESANFKRNVTILPLRVSSTEENSSLLRYDSMQASKDYQVWPMHVVWSKATCPGDLRRFSGYKASWWGASVRRGEAKRKKGGKREPVHHVVAKAQSHWRVLHRDQR